MRLALQLKFKNNRKTKQITLLSKVVFEIRFKSHRYHAANAKLRMLTHKIEPVIG